jgi:hypothetical protein
MQLELTFQEQFAQSTTPPQTSWQEIDPQAQITALEILARLIAHMLAAKSTGGASDD